MKWFFLVVTVVFLPMTDAVAETAKSILKTDTVNESDLPRTTFETGLHLHSINNGSQFLSLGLVRDVSSWATVGVRGVLPLEYSDENQVYFGQVLARINFLKTKSRMALEGTASQGFFAESRGTRFFALFGLSYLFTRDLTPEFTLGVNIGVDYGSRVYNDLLDTNANSIYNKIALVGGYNF
jgi:hypothetical protein